MKSWKDIHAIIAVSLVGVFIMSLPLTIKSQSAPPTLNLLPGQTVTKLSDGKLLLLGGESIGGSLNTASIWDPRSGATTQVSATMSQGRAWHTATVLPDGLVLVLGGLGSNNQLVANAELFDPATRTFASLSSTGVSPRAHHTATLLSDGHVLIAGGVGSTGQTLQTAELWDAINPSSVSVSSGVSQRRDHGATLLADGRVLLWGGADGSGNALNNGDLFDPATGRFMPVPSFPTSLISPSSDSPLLVASIPLDRSVDIDTESMISLRFSKPLRVESVNSDTVSLSGPKGVEKILVVSAENGSLAFITPESHLLPGSTYTVSLNGAIDTAGLALPFPESALRRKVSQAAGRLPLRRRQAAMA